jgi:hypothetical protein
MKGQVEGLSTKIGVGLGIFSRDSCPLSLYDARYRSF